MENDLKYNGSGYRDIVAEKAIREADRPPCEISELVDIIKKIAGAYGYDVEGRIAFQDKKTKIIYKRGMKHVENGLHMRSLQETV